MPHAWSEPGTPTAGRPRRLPRALRARLADVPRRVAAAAAARCASRPRRSTPSAGWPTTRSISTGGGPDALAATARAAGRAPMRAGRCDSPVDRALADVVGAFAIPRELPEALLEGFAWDAAGRRYDDLAELQAYAARVAGTVGAMMALLMGVRDARGAGAGLRPRRRHAAHQHRPRRRRGRPAPAASTCRSTGCGRRASTRTPGWPGRCSARALASRGPAAAAAPRTQLYRARRRRHRPAAARLPARASRRRACSTPRSAARWSGAGSNSVARRAVVPLPPQAAAARRAPWQRQRCRRPAPRRRRWTRPASWSRPWRRRRCAGRMRRVRGHRHGGISSTAGSGDRDVRAAGAARSRAGAPRLRRSVSR